MYGIALIQEYDEEFASICGMDMDTMYQSILNKAAGLKNRIQLEGMALLTVDSYGDHHELTTFMTCESKERFLRAAALLNKEAYCLAAVTAEPPAAGQEEREENRN